MRKKSRISESEIKPLQRGSDESASSEETERLPLIRHLDRVEIEARFREDIANGKITSDIVILDEDGQPIIDKTSHNIFDL